MALSAPLTVKESDASSSKLDFDMEALDDRHTAARLHTPESNGLCHDYQRKNSRLSSSRIMLGLLPQN